MGRNNRPNRTTSRLNFWVDLVKVFSSGHTTATDKRVEWMFPLTFRSLVGNGMRGQTSWSLLSFLENCCFRNYWFVAYNTQVSSQCIRTMKANQICGGQTSGKRSRHYHLGYIKKGIFIFHVTCSGLCKQLSLLTLNFSFATTMKIKSVFVVKN